MNFIIYSRAENLPSFIVYHTRAAFDIADPGSMQEACHMTLVNGLAHHESVRSSMDHGIERSPSV